MTKKQEIYNKIKENIILENYQLGERLPSEKNLAKEYNVSVFTIRSVLNELVFEGLIEKKPGSGSYVSENFAKKNNILLPIYNFMVQSGSISIIYTIEKLKELCLSKNYNLTVAYINKMDSLERDLNIDGVLHCVTRSSFSYWTRKKIPVVSILNTVGEEYPSVVFCYRTFYRYLYNLIEKYNFKKIVFFAFGFETGEKNIEIFTHIGFHDYLRKNYKAKLCYINKNTSSIKKRINTYLKNLTYKPDLIVFSDDVIFKPFAEIYDKKKFDGVKVITCANVQENYNADFDYCGLVFDLEERAKVSFSLLEKLMKNEFVGKTNIFIKPKIINEEALK